MTVKTPVRLSCNLTSFDESHERLTGSLARAAEIAVQAGAGRSGFAILAARRVLWAVANPFEDPQIIRAACRRLARYIQDAIAVSPKARDPRLLAALRRAAAACYAHAWEWDVRFRGAAPLCAGLWLMD